MINKILLENFRAFKKAEIEIKPITLLVGPNNGGKTSILQSIRLIQQTLRGSGVEVLNFRDPLNLGDFDTVVHQNSKEKEIRFKIDLENKKYFDVKIFKKQGKLFVKQFSCNNGEFEYFLDGLIENRDDNKEKFNSEKFETIKFKPERYDKIIKSSNITPIFSRDSFFIKIRPAIEDIILESGTLKSFIEYSIEDEEDKESMKAKEAKKRLTIFLTQLYNLERMSIDFYQNTKQSFENIKYIGPIRATADRSYEKKKYDDVGLTGEHAVQILANNIKLQEDVEEHLKNMYIINSLQVENFGKQQNLELKIKTKITEKGVNFADTGCGTAQILPIIIQSLISKKDSLTLIEQPEVHLHPKVQADLADFFISVASEETKFLLETHSDYFIERIRYAIMNNDIPVENLAIYYIEQDEAKKSSTINKIEINSDGQYLNLPESFITNFKLQETRKITKKLLETLKE